MGTFEGRPGPDTGQGQTSLTSSRDRFNAGVAAGATALIVDDDYRNTFALTVLLKRGRMTVVAANSGPIALGILEERVDIGIVLMDIMMPVMDGYEAMIRIRKRPQCAELPIIAITGKALAGERARCLAAGASDYLPKPIDTEALATTINRWLVDATTRLPSS
jgi:CheY-like chemotaxis protein